MTEQKREEHHSEEHHSIKTALPRRNFLTIIAGFFAAIWGLMTLYPIYRYLSPRNSLAENNVSSVNAGKASDIPVDSGKNIQFGSIPALITHTKDGKFHAYSAVCSHLGCTVQYRQDMGRIYCACHGGQYDPETGQNIAGPPPKPLTPLKVEVKNNDIIVSA